MTAAREPGWLPRLMLCALGLALPFVLVGILIDDPEARVRSLGGILQVLGLLGLAVGIRDLRKQFKLPSIPSELATEARTTLATTVGWLRKVFRRPKRQDYTLKAEGFGVTVTPGVGRFSARSGPGTALPDRVSRLEQNFDALERIVLETEEELAREGEVRKQAMASEAAERQSADALLGERVESFAVGGIRLEIVGWIWLFVGTLLATWAPEIAACISR